MGERAKRLSKKALGIVASLALAIGLMPLPVAALTAEPAFAADATPHTVTVIGGTADKTTAIEGETVTITANAPGENMAFLEWDADDNNLNLKETGWSEATFEMPATDVTLTAVFKEIIIGKISPQTYTGNYITPTLVVSLDGVDIHLELDTDYTVTYKNNLEKGTAEAIVEFRNGRTGSRTATFDITAAGISNAEIEAIGLVYGDRPTVTWNDQTLEEGKDYTMTLSNTRVGEATATITGKGNFTGSKVSDEFTIAQRPVTITADSVTQEYNGKPLTAGDYTSEGLAKGDEISSATVEGSQTDVGSSPNVVSEAKIVNADGEDVTDCYAITYESGALTVEPAQAAITVDNASKVVGEADPVFTGTVTGLVKDGDLGEIKYFRTNKDETAGTYEGVLDAAFTENANYDVMIAPGNFTIKALYTVTWLDGDGSVLQTKTYAEGDTPPEYDGKTPTKAATAQFTYVFTGWDSGTVKGTTTTYKPLFDEVPITATLTFNLAGGTLDGKTGSYTITANVGDTIEIPKAPTRTGYTFKYWKGSEYKPGDKYTVEGDHTFTAVWEQSSTAAAKTTPKTGDDNGTLAIVISVVAVASLCAVAFSVRKRRNER